MKPAQEYQQRLASAQERVQKFEQRHILIGNIRLAIACIFLFILWLTLSRHSISEWWVITPVAAFLALVIYHSRVLRSRDCAQRVVEFYRKGILRLEDRWQGTGESGDRFADPHHVYSADLDLFGQGGLFELLSTARTRIGENTLASWLLSPAAASKIPLRQQAVAELRNRLDLREDLAVLGEDARVGVHPEALLIWSKQRPLLTEKWVKALAVILALIFIATAIWWGITGLATPMVVAILAQTALWFRVKLRVLETLHGTEHAFEDLDLLSSLLERWERERFESPLLRDISTRISSHHIPGSAAIAQLRKIVNLVYSRDNLFLRILDVPLQYSTLVAYSVEKWRSTHGAAVERWLEAVGEFESLSSLAAYSFEHPSDVFPELVLGSAVLEAEEIGHPLLPDSKCVRNNVHLSGGVSILLISGSNMSGKSTLMRSVGLNTVLAMAGAPVRARVMRLAPLQVGASIRINDSLQEGSSRFYAEVKRLRDIVDLANHQPALLFLLDELLQGTNSKDRRIGADGIVRGLLKRGAIGLVTTHDLALTEIGDELGSRLQNVHFEDQFADGVMTFDYKLRRGVVTKSNGIELMRSVGLEV